MHPAAMRGVLLRRQPGLTHSAYFGMLLPLSLNTHAGVAQLVERLFCKQMVAGSNPAAGSTARRRPTTLMSQENLIKFECTECKGLNYHSKKNKKKLKTRLELKKFCKRCKARVTHKETK
jgi:large subunit ribosomal protein L33